MDRQIVYVGQVPLDTDELNTNKNIYIGLAKLSGAVLGVTQILNGFTCTPTSPAGMTVNVGLGEIYSLQEVDTSSYGSLPDDTSDLIVKQGVVLGTTNLSCPAPLTSGYSINYLIEVSFLEQDTNSVVLPYYNSSNINAPYSGPGNDGASQNTTRQNTATVSVKAGAAAATHTQVTPNPDTGYTGAWIVTVAYGATTITSGNIAVYSAASFINETLTQKISQPTADLRYTQITRVQDGYYWAATDTGTANTYVASISPNITTLATGQIVLLIIGNTNTGASTLALNGLTAKNITLTNGGTPLAGDIVAGMVAYLVYDGTEFQIINPVSRISAGQIQSGALLYTADTGTANSYIGTLSPVPGSYTNGMKFSIKIANTNTSASTINLNSLGGKNIKLTSGAAVNAGDLLAGGIYDLQYNGTAFELLNPSTWASTLQVQNGSIVFAADGGSANTYTASISPVPSAYTTGMNVWIQIANTNTGASTLNLNSLGAINIKLTTGAAINAGDLLAGGTFQLSYDGTNFELLNPATWVSQKQLQSGALVYAASTSAANAYTASLTPAITAYTTGMLVRILFTNTNTGAATINLNSIGAVSLTREDASALISGDIPANTAIDLEYDGTGFRFTGTKIWQFPSLQSMNGYMKFPNGIIMQWGQTNGVAGTTHATVTLPISFVSGGLNCQITYENTTVDVTLLPFTFRGFTALNQFDVYNGNSTSMECRYFVIGV